MGIEIREDKPVKSKSLAGPSEICLLMPIRPGFVDSLETRSYESRLRSFSKLFSDLRTISRESRLTRPYSDVVDRLQTIQGVTISLMGNEVLLTVHFDRPWEPYIRIIWRDLGRIFDLILCNCEGYEKSHRFALGYQAFARWIRKYQVETNTYYTDSNHTVSDVIYLDQLEKRVQSQDTPSASSVSRLVARSPVESAAITREFLTGDDYVEYIKMGVQAVSAFHGLTYLYAKGSSHHDYLLEAARSVLPTTEFPKRANWVMESDSLGLIQTIFKVELDWFENYVPAIDSPPDVRVPPHSPDSVQSGITQPAPANQGCTALLQIVDVEKAKKALARVLDEMTFGTATPAEEIYKNMGFTPEGLRKLGVPEAQMRQFPPAFLEGMASRAGLIGDIRYNHPDQWRLPARNWPLDPNNPRSKTSEQPIVLESVDVVFQMRHQTNTAGPEIPAHSPMLEVLKRLERHAEGGLLILGYEAVYSLGEDGAAREHFGFRDGISNPSIRSSGGNKHEHVLPGDIFLGQENSVEDRVNADWTAPLFFDGTFQVLRKLSQHVKPFREALGGNVDHEKDVGAARDRLAERLMGRGIDGTALPGLVSPGASINDFRFEDDPLGDLCPLFSHIRRVNPRDDGDKGKEPIPRIIRRGMSFGPDYESAPSAPRGLLFSAFNANIAEQFEVLQRWIAAGNRTTPYSKTSCPFLGVPDSGTDRIYRFADGERVNLGDQPFVTLDWGLYLFMPSREGLQHLLKLPVRSAPAFLAQGRALIDQLEAMAAQSQCAYDSVDNPAYAAWKRLLEEKDSRDAQLHRALWEAIRKDHNGVLRTPIGHLVGKKELIYEVLTHKTDYSVSEYKKRLDQGVGRNYLGMDGCEHAKYADAPNEVFATMRKKEGFAAAHQRSCKLLEGLGSLGGQVTIPLTKFIDLALAEVSKSFFGVPDATTLVELRAGLPANPHAAIQSGDEPLWDSSAYTSGGGQAVTDTAHCPYHFVSTSRSVFQPLPTGFVQQLAADQGKVLRRQMDQFAARLVRQPDSMSDLQRRIFESSQPGDFSSVVLGALLGYMPTVQGNFLETARDWLRSGEFWRVQNEYQSCRLDGAEPLAAAKRCIEPALGYAMAKRPVPSLIHRTTAKQVLLGGKSISAGESVVLGLVSATAETGFDDIAPVFGGEYSDYSSDKAVHACPGRKVALGTLLGLFAALFEVRGTLQPAASPMALLFRAHAPQ